MEALPPRSPRPATPLASFYALLLTQTFSLIGSRMTTVAIGIFIFRETGQTAPLLLISFFNELPGMLVGGLAGVLVDRWKLAEARDDSDRPGTSGRQCPADRQLPFRPRFSCGMSTRWRSCKGAFSTLQARRKVPR